ncbi:hypothetical protein [Endozoicomonas lisbonensis]
MDKGSLSRIHSNHQHNHLSQKFADCASERADDDECKDMQVKRVLAIPTLICSILLAGGCSPLPQATNPSNSPQGKLQSAQHWKAIARHVSERIIEQADISTKALYLDEKQLDTQFSRVFSKQLVSELVSNKVSLQLSPASASVRNALQLMIEIDAIKHPDDRDGTYLPLSPALANAWFIWSLKSDAVFGFVPTVVAVDVYNSLPTRTNSEVVVTTKLMDGQKVYFSETNVYYITDLSMSQFKKLRTTHLTNQEVPDGDLK